MKRLIRLSASIAILLSLVAAYSLIGSTASADSNTAFPVFDGLTPAPFTTVAPGTISVAAHAQSDVDLSNVTLMLNGSQIAETGNGSSNSVTVSQPQLLSAGTYTATAAATDADGKQFKAQWDFVVSSDANESEWFTASGQPKADQINATIRSLVEAFRWHLYGLSWDGSNHPDLPTHVGLAGTGDPLSPWVTGTTFDQSNTNATLRSLVEAFRWHFWGISWDGSDHPDIPTHASTVQGPQSIDPWFDTNGNPIPDNISATLRSLVESFRWHFWGYSWDGSRHPDLPTHAEYLNDNSNQPTPPTDEGTPSPTETTPSGTPTTGPDDGNPLEASTVYQSPLTSVASFSAPSGASGGAVADGYTITLPPGVADGATSGTANYGDASYSLDLKKLTTDGNSTSCLVYRATQSGASGAYYQYCLLYSGDSLVGVQAVLITADNISSSTNVNTVAGFQLDPPVSAMDWHNLKVIAKGNQFWFYFDDQYQGMATFSGPSSGTIGFSAYNLDTDVTQTFEYANLTVKSLQP
ncbi:MAG: Ig-like domain-containing protein [Nitrolancea sp.]